MSVRECDTVLACPLFGFERVSDYYKEASCVDDLVRLLSCNKTNKYPDVAIKCRYV